jgi:hypothetical protein
MKASLATHHARRQSPLTLLALALFALGAGDLHSQPAPVQQFQNSRLNQQSPQLSPSLAASTNAPELYQGENVDVGPQRILRLKPRHQYFNILLDSQVFYSDNANFAPTKEKIGSTIFVNTFQAAITPRDINLGDGKLSSTLGFASQWYNYENEAMSPLDFNAQTVFLGAKYAHGYWLVALDASFTRLVNQRNDYNLNYQEILPALTLQRFIPISKTLLLTVGNQLDYHFTDEPTTFATYSEINNRLDDIVSVTFTWQITSKLLFQPGYRFMFTNYRYDTMQTSDRNDYLNSATVSLAYYISQNFSLRTFFNYNANASDDRFASAYHETNGGVGLSLNLIF